MGSSFWGHLDPSHIAIPWYVLHSVEVGGSLCIYFLPQLPQHPPHSRLAVLPRRLFSSWYATSSLSRATRFISTVREPLDRLDPLHRHFDFWEVLLYVMGLAFLLEGASVFTSHAFSTKS